MGAERALSSDGQDMDPKDWHQIRESIQQGDVLCCSPTKGSRGNYSRPR